MITEHLDRQYIIRKLAKRMIDNRNNYKKTLKEIETEAISLLDIPGTVLYQIALQFDANQQLKDCN